MPLFKSITIPGGLLSVWQMTEPSDELQCFLTPEELADPAFQKFTYEKRKAEWLATRCLLKQMIGSPFQLSYTKLGKPILSHLVYKHISISHSRDFVAVMVHQDKTVGIDIESVNRNYASIKKRYLSDAELEKVNENSFFHCIYWCAKEAVFKLVEESEIDFRKQIEILFFDPQRDTFFARFVCGDKEKTYELHHATFNEHCMVWICSDLD